MNFSNKWCVLPVLVMLLSVGDVGAAKFFREDSSVEFVEVNDASSSYTKSDPLLSQLELRKSIQEQAGKYRARLRVARTIKQLVLTAPQTKIAEKTASSPAKLSWHDAYYNEILGCLEYDDTANTYTQDAKDLIARIVRNLERDFEALDSYDSPGDFFVKRMTKSKFAVMPGSSWYGKIFYGFIAMALENFGDAVDKQFEKTSNSIMKRFSRSMWNIFAAAGFISPLSAEQVDSWIHALERYRSSMDKLSSTSTQDSSFANTFAHRDKGRPEKQSAGKEDAALEGEAKKKKQIPAYVTITDVTVSQLRSQIGYILQSVDSSYVHQRSLLNDTLMILDDIRARVFMSHEENQSPVLTQSLKNDFIALCDTAISELQSLLDMLNIDKESSTETKSSSSSSKKPSDSRLFGRD
jgi:hypothetical protein